ncbi:uncharacterized protein LOC130636854 [Hydractinia symbiolongicarpus]|uniref:uncharacterized protein LOC130636854 n=1 Tax=Hydractinia symbiolongicarpus TaxID=13093 RepID=UPI00254B153A|nr:uncharacterized protein LOC130636854 [Hydractinia symbiolongicarpus]
MRRSERIADKVRIDYKSLHATGAINQISSEVQDTPVDGKIVVMASEDTSISKNSDPVIQLSIDESILADDIDDFVDENQSGYYGESIEDIDSNIKQMENLRTQYRRKHRELSANLKELYEGTYGKSYTLKIESMKSFVMMKRERRQRLRERQNLGDIESSERKMKFLVNEIIQLISYLQESFTSSLSTLDDKEIKKRKEDLPEQLSQMETLRKSFKEMIETAKGKDEGNLDDLNKRYDKLVDLKNCYIKTLDQEYQDRELSKVEKFNSSTLNIKLPIFKGYGSVCDIYTFQTDFRENYCFFKYDVFFLSRFQHRSQKAFCSPSYMQKDTTCPGIEVAQNQDYTQITAPARFLCVINILSRLGHNAKLRYFGCELFRTKVNFGDLSSGEENGFLPVFPVYQKTEQRIKRRRPTRKDQVT